MERRTYRWKRVALLFLGALAGCQSYEERPLDPQEVLEEATRRRGAAGPLLSLEQAVEQMRAHNPRVREARAAQATARAVADTKTPLPNPTIEIAPTRYFGPDVLKSSRWGVEAALGWTVLGGRRRRLTDDLNQFVAEEAMVKAIATEREEYLSLRREFTALAVAGRALEANKDLAAALEATHKQTRRLADAAQADALDVVDVGLEAKRAELAVATAREKRDERALAVAARIGLGRQSVPSGRLAPLPATVPGVERLHAVLLRDNPELARRRAAYAITEKRLELEIRKQYPALNIGFGYERVGAEDKYSLGFGIEIPAFDRNQGGIAEAQARREELRIAFEAEVTRALSAIEAARARLVSRRERLGFLRKTIVPLAEQSLDLARRSLQAGGANTLRLLTAVRMARQVTLEERQTEGAVYEAWSDLEQACGAPLLHFGKDTR